MKSILILILSLFTSASMASSFYVSNVKASGTAAPSEASAVKSLVSQSVNNMDGHNTTSSASSSDYVLTPELVKLGDKVILSLTKSKNGSIVFSKKMKTTSFNDIDLISERLVTAVINEKSIEGTQSVSNITNEEKENSNVRIKATKQWFVGIGPGVSSNLEGESGGFDFNIGMLWGLDDNFSLSLAWEIFSGRGEDESRFTNLAMGGIYYLTQKKNTPFVGASIGYGSAQANDDKAFFSTENDDASGWSLSATAGYHMYRTSTVNFAVLGRYTQILDKLEVSDKLPGLFTINLALYY